MVEDVGLWRPKEETVEMLVYFFSIVGVKRMCLALGGGRSHYGCTEYRVWGGT